MYLKDVKAKKKCVYCNMCGKNRSVGLDFFFSTQATETHILAIIMLHQHTFCVYKGKGKLKLPITRENFVLFAVYQFLFCFVNMFLENVEKGLDRHLVRMRTNLRY